MSELVYSLRIQAPINFSEFFRPIVLSQIIYMTVVLLLTRYLLYRFYLKRRYLKLILSVIMVFVIFVFLRYLLEEIIFPVLFHFRNYPKGTSIRYYAFDNLAYGFGYMILGIVFFFIEYQFDVQKREAELIQRSKEAELIFLRTQISPHFLFNSLNSIYSLSYKQSVKASEAILQLSELMRFMLYEQKPLIALAKEWEYVLNYISLQEMRYPYALKKDIQVMNSPDTVQVPPFLLIPLIENAFKHGDFSDDAYPLYIRLAAGNAVLDFEVRNRIAHHQKEQEGGVGLENIQRRLMLLYPGRHFFTIQKSLTIYTVQLHIDL